MIELIIGYFVIEPTLHTNKVFDDKIKNGVYKLNSFSIGGLISVNIADLFVASANSLATTHLICFLLILLGLGLILEKEGIKL